MPFSRCAAVIIVLTIAFGWLPAASAAPVPFPDLERTWYRYREAIAYLKDREVIGGYPDGTFKPKETINRAELLKIVFKGKSDIVPASRRCFSDVPPEEWYAPYVCAAKQRGIVSGYPNGTFKPYQAVNFAEAIKIVLNAYDHRVDEAEGGQWFAPYVRFLDRADILADHSYVPWAPMTRERAADLLWRMLRNQEERFIPRLSPGCGKAPSILPPTSVEVFGKTREFLLTIPSGYVAHDPSPLVIAFHGRTNSNEQVRSYMRLDRELPENFIAYPAALRAEAGSFSWADPGDKAQGIRDIAFFDALVEKLAETYCIDMDRISVVGHSLGAWMANTVACVRGDVVMASATVGGDSVITTCAGPAAAMIAHNPKDTLAAFSGAEKVLKLRKEANVCLDRTEPGPTELNCVRHATCAGGNTILWCPHTIDTDERGQFYPHTWPRDTANVIREFLRSME